MPQLSDEQKRRIHKETELLFKRLESPVYMPEYEVRESNGHYTIRQVGKK